MQWGVALGAGAKAGMDTYEKMSAEERAKKADKRLQDQADREAEAANNDKSYNADMATKFGTVSQRGQAQPAAAVPPIVAGIPAQVPVPQVVQPPAAAPAFDPAAVQDHLQDQRLMSADYRDMASIAFKYGKADVGRAYAEKFFDKQADAASNAILELPDWKSAEKMMEGIKGVDLTGTQNPDGSFTVATKDGPSKTYADFDEFKAEQAMIARGNPKETAEFLATRADKATQRRVYAAEIASSEQAMKFAADEHPLKMEGMQVGIANTNDEMWARHHAAGLADRASARADHAAAGGIGPDDKIIDGAFSKANKFAASSLSKQGIEPSDPRYSQMFKQVQLSYITNQTTPTEQAHLTPFFKARQPAPAPAPVVGVPVLHAIPQPRGVHGFTPAEVAASKAAFEAQQRSDADKQVAGIKAVAGLKFKPPGSF